MSEVVLAYDGSIHADWVARYAIRLARAAGAGLEVLHVDDGALTASAVDERLAHIVEIGSASGVDVSGRHVPLTATGVAGAIDAAVPRNEGHIVVTGLRARRSSRGLLRGTVSERLLRSMHHDVLAIRVVSPALLGHPRHLLFCLSENPHSVDRAAPFVRLLAPELTRLSLLTVVSPRLGALSRPTHDDLRALRDRGWDVLGQAEARLRGVLAPFDIPFDPHVSVSEDWAGEITREAGRTRAELVLMGSTERSLASRLLAGNPHERVLDDAICDVAIFRRARVGAR
jgi:nucleotide-binding universal stress UspA family protein